MTADSNETPPDTDTLNIPVVQSPGLNVVKSSTTSSVTAAGQVVPYKFTVTNTGNVTLTGVTVSDPKCTSAAVGRRVTRTVTRSCSSPRRGCTRVITR